VWSADYAESRIEEEEKEYIHRFHRFTQIKEKDEGLSIDLSWLRYRQLSFGWRILCLL
jgi:hypothetical protein